MAERGGGTPPTTYTRGHVKARRKNTAAHSMPPQRVLELGSADFDEIFQHAVTMELLTESQLDAFTDDIASGQASELELLSEWAPRVSVVAKDRGNQLFAQKDVQGARDSYELAIRCDSKNRSACCNLALMYLKLNFPDQAALAANTALTLTDKTKPFDSIYWKARYRRGLAFEALGKLEYCLLYTSPSPRDRQKSRMPSSA